MGLESTDRDLLSWHIPVIPTLERQIQEDHRQPGLGRKTVSKVKNSVVGGAYL